MTLNHLKDQELLAQVKQLVQSERQLLTKILHHLREVERRKLFCDLGYQSLFEYAVKELKYSEGQAGRRIQAMRLIQELPEVEERVASGKLSLSNLCQAQSYFREVKKEAPERKVHKSEKLEVLKSLENKSTREGQKLLLELNSQATLPKERERVISETHTEIRFVITEELKSQLEELRALMGPKGAQMSLAELVAFMTNLSLKTLKTKKFGKKRIEGVTEQIRRLPTSNASSSSRLPVLAPTSELPHNRNSRQISRAVRCSVWHRDHGRCRQCGSRRNLNLDHIKPLAMGGNSEAENLRLLCFNCNQRQAIKSFGINQIQRCRKANSRPIEVS